MARKKRILDTKIDMLDTLGVKTNGQEEKRSLGLSQDSVQPLSQDSVQPLSQDSVQLLSQDSVQLLSQDRLPPLSQDRLQDNSPRESDPWPQDSLPSPTDFCENLLTADDPSALSTHELRQHLSCMPSRSHDATVTMMLGRLARR